ncbi:MAG: hypothetical protein U0Z26_05980 [Anaerolineales bacterium]
MRYFDFTEEELNSNRNGFFSPKQKEMFATMAAASRQHPRSGVWVILGFAGLGTCILLALFLTTANARTLQTLGPQILVGLGFAFVAIFVMIALMFFLSNRQAALFEEAQLFSVEGVVRHDSSYSEQGGFKSYYVYFDKKRFAYADDLSKVFPEGKRFRVYYGKAGKVELIMSYEKLT